MMSFESRRNSLSRSLTTSYLSPPEIKDDFIAVIADSRLLFPRGCRKFPAIKYPQTGGKYKTISDSAGGKNHPENTVREPWAPTWKPQCLTNVVGGSLGGCQQKEITTGRIYWCIYFIFLVFSVSWRTLVSTLEARWMSLVWRLAATGSLFNSIETGSRNPADAASAKFSCQDIFCGETHNMLVAKITLTQPTHKTDRWYWMISHKPRLWAVTTFSSLLCQEFSNPYSCAICSPHMQHDGGFFRF